MSNRVTHFEIPCSNPEKTMNFFKSTFDTGSGEAIFLITGSPCSKQIASRQLSGQPVVRDDDLLFPTTPSLRMLTS